MSQDIFEMLYFIQSNEIQKHSAVGSESSGVAGSILALTYTFVEIDHEIVSTVILLLPLIQEG